MTIYKVKGKLEVAPLRSTKSTLSETPSNINKNYMKEGWSHNEERDWYTRNNQKSKAVT